MNQGDMGLAFESLPDVINQLEDTMNREAKNLNFEEAAKLRDRIKILRKKLVRGQ